MLLLFNIILPILLVIFLSLSIKYFIPILIKFKFIDSPNERSNHLNPIPKGIGLIITIFFCLSVIFAIHHEFINIDPWLGIIIITLIISIYCFFDDLYNFSSLKKLLFQSLVVAVSLYLYIDLTQIFSEETYLRLPAKIPFFIYKFFILTSLYLFWLWIMNLFNFMDGIDGITASQICVFSVGLVLLSNLELIETQFSYLGIFMFSSFLAFLFFNFPPAKVFLGDSGSISIGYFVGAILVYCFLKESAFVQLLIIILYYFLDSTLTLLKRFIKKENLLAAHSDHFYQIKIRNGYSHLYVLLFVLLIIIFLLILAVLYSNFPYSSVVLSFALVSIFLIWLTK